jgi:hypothetical protein
MSSANALPERAEQIFAAAYELFAAQGYHRTSMDAIAERAGVPRAPSTVFQEQTASCYIDLFHPSPWASSNPVGAPTEEGAYIISH